MHDLKEIKKMLNETRKIDDLVLFKNKKGESFCKKHNITGAQLNFLLSVIAVEKREKKNKKWKKIKNKF